MSAIKEKKINFVFELFTRNLFLYKTDVIKLKCQIFN